MTNHTPDPGLSPYGPSEPPETASPVYSATYAIAAEYGPEVAIETTAQCLDIYCGEWMGAGDILRDAWKTLVAELMRRGPAAAASSGAVHELAYYGGGV